MVTGAGLGQFTDAFVDRIIEQAGRDGDPAVAALANSIRRRRPPKLLREVCVFEANGTKAHAGILFKQACRHGLKAMAERRSLHPGRFLVCETRPLTLEERGGLLTEQQAREIEPEEREELIKVFAGSQPEPVSVVSIDHSILKICSNHFFQSFRLYFVRADDDPPNLVDELQVTVRGWGTG